MVAIGFSTGFGAANAAQDEVSMQEAIVRKGPNNTGMAAEWYPEQVERLARVYHEYGRRRESEETYKKALELYGQLPGGAEKIPTVKMVYAGVLAHPPYGVSNNLPSARRAGSEAGEKTAHAADLVKAQSVANESIALIESKRRPDDQDVYLLFSAVSIFEDAGNMVRREQVIALIDKILTRQAGEPPADQWHYSRIGENLNKIANLYCHDIPEPNLPEGPAVPVFTDGKTHNEYGVDVKNFRISESYRLRAMQQYDRLPANNEQRIEAQRMLAYWYRRYGQTKAFQIQAQKLSALLRTSDPKVLYPHRTVCYGCGRG